jgi:glycosyltransferase involved in cell wall biosynthesis
MSEPGKPILPTAALPDRAGMSDAERLDQQRFRERYRDWVEGVHVHRAVPSPRVTLVVVSFRAKDYLLDCLRHLRAQTVAGEVDYEILLADSGGLEHLRSRYGDLVDVDLRLKHGLPLNVARNAAAAWARGELIAYIDDDGLVARDWLARALEVMRAPEIALARGRILPHRHPYFNLYAGHYDRGEALWDDDSLATEGNMLARRAVYFEIGGFPDQFYGAEGCRLVYQLKQAHPEMRAVYAPGMVMRHDYCRTLREFVWKCRRYRTTNDDTTRDDPGFAAFLASYLRKPKPSPSRSLAQRAALRTMKASAWLIVRVDAFDRVERR